MTATTLVLLLGPPLACGPAAPSPRAAALESDDPRLEALYRAGREFDDFLETAERRRELWVRNYEEGQVAEDLLARARALEGRWRLLAIAEDWCSDSVSTLPFLALLAESSDALELRVVDSETARGVMDAYRTPDDRTATPTLLVLDHDYAEVGCWIERPSELQTWAIVTRPTLDDREFLTRKMAWYEEDAGRSTVREVLERIEAAASGSRICPPLP